MGKLRLMFSEGLSWALPPEFRFIMTPRGVVGVLSFSEKLKHICSCGHFSSNRGLFPIR